MTIVVMGIPPHHMVPPNGPEAPRKIGGAPHRLAGLLLEAAPTKVPPRRQWLGPPRSGTRPSSGTPIRQHLGKLAATAKSPARGGADEPGLGTCVRPRRVALITIEGIRESQTRQAAEDTDTVSIHICAAGKALRWISVELAPRPPEPLPQSLRFA
jgi:hypothetical protein